MGLGFLHVRLIDQGFTDSKLLFRKTNLTYRLGYGRETQRSVFNFVTSLTMGNIEPKTGYGPSEFYLADIMIEYLRRIHSYKLFDKKNTLYGGIRLSTINHGLVSMRSVDNVSIFSMHGVYLDLQNRFLFNEKHSIETSLFLPIAVYNNRILWKGGASRYTYQDVQNIPRLMMTNGEFSYFAMFNSVQFDLNYIKKIGMYTNVEVRYSFLYTANFIEAPIRVYSNKLMIGLKFFL